MYLWWRLNTYQTLREGNKLLCSTVNCVSELVLPLLYLLLASNLVINALAPLHSTYVAASLHHKGRKIPIYALFKLATIAPHPSHHLSIDPPIS